MEGKEEDRTRFLDRTIFTYSTSHLSSTDKVRFYYALKGRDGDSGILSELSITQLGKTVLLADSNHQREISGFLSSWGCPHSQLPVRIEAPQQPTTNRGGAKKKRLQEIDRPMEVLRTP